MRSVGLPLTSYAIRHDVGYGLCPAQGRDVTNPWHLGTRLFQLELYYFPHKFGFIVDDGNNTWTTSKNAYHLAMSSYYTSPQVPFSLRGTLA